MNTWAAENSPQFNGLASGALASWASPACSVQETFDAWPAGFGGVAYDAGVTPAEFTASDGVTGQAYVLLGAPVTAATAQLAPTVGGELLSGMTAGGSNSAAPGASGSVTPVADGVDAANGDFTQSSTDFSIPTFGPPLDFTRTYDAQSARQETVAGTPVAAGAPGSMGYGWTDNWDSWLSVGSPVPEDIYRIAGPGTTGTTGTAGNGGPALHAQLQNPFGVTTDPQGDLFIADTYNNRVQEVAAYNHTQFGVAMTAGDVYTVAGSASGSSGHSGDGGLATSGLLFDPYGVAVDGGGNLYIADWGNDRIQEVAAATGSQWGQSMTASDIYTVAGSASGTSGHSGDGGPAASALLSGPQDVVVDGQGNLYIADSANARVQEVAAATGTQWGQSMTATDIYTVAGSATGTAGDSGNGGPAASALMTMPVGVAVDAAGDLYIADTLANQVREVASATGTQWRQSMTSGDIYTVAGNSAGTSGSTGDGTLATSALLNGPWAVAVDASGNLYVADTGNSRVQEVPVADGTQWGQSMTATYTYTVAGTGVYGHARGPGHPDTLHARAELAAACQAAGQPAAAIGHHRRILAEHERAHGPHHLATITARENLASACLAAGRHKDAISGYKRTLADRQRVLGGDHPDTVGAQRNLAAAYQAAGKIAAALQQHEQACAGYERILGAGHRDTLTCRAGLASAYHAAGRLTDAAALLRDTLSRCEQALPPGDPLIVAVQEALTRLAGQ